MGHLGHLGLARQALNLHQLGGFYRQGGKVVAKGFRNNFLRLVQVVAGIHQVAGGLHGFRATNGLQDECDRIGVGQNIFGGVEKLARQQGLGKRPGARQGLRLLGQVVRRGGHQGRQGGRGLRPGGQTFHAVIFGRKGCVGWVPQASRNDATAFTWSSAMKVGAWPTPSNSTKRAFSLRASMPWAVAWDNKSDCAPRVSKMSA